MISFIYTMTTRALAGVDQVFGAVAGD